jgi:hypothetical protein
MGEPRAGERGALPGGGERTGGTDLAGGEPPAQTPRSPCCHAAGSQSAWFIMVRAGRLELPRPLQVVASLGAAQHGENYEAIG